MNIYFSHFPLFNVKVINQQICIVCIVSIFRDMQSYLHININLHIIVWFINKHRSTHSFHRVLFYNLYEFVVIICLCLFCKFPQLVSHKGVFGCIAGKHSVWPNTELILVIQAGMYATTYWHKLICLWTHVHAGTMSTCRAFCFKIDLMWHAPRVS